MENYGWDLYSSSFYFFDTGLFLSLFHLWRYNVYFISRILIEAHKHLCMLDKTCILQQSIYEFSFKIEKNGISKILCIQNSRIFIYDDKILSQLK